MSLLIVGSQAMKHHLGKINREPSDIDYLCHEEDWQKMVDAFKFTANIIERDGNKGHIFTATNVHYEFDIAKEDDSTDLILKRHPLGMFAGYATLDELYLLKMSHRFKKNSPHFLKTMGDIHILRKAGATIKLELEDILKLREKETYTYSHPKLNVSKQEFFKKEEVPYTYDHDEIHKVVAFLDKPAYTYYMVDGEQVKASMDKFFEQPEEIKLLGVLEESLVLAAERSQIPNNFENIPVRTSFNIALEKVCTSITSGKFREYAWEKYYIVQKLYDTLGGNSWVDKVKSAIEKGELMSFEEGMV